MHDKTETSLLTVDGQKKLYYATISPGEVTRNAPHMTVFRKVEGSEDKTTGLVFYVKSERTIEIQFSGGEGERVPVHEDSDKKQSVMIGGKELFWRRKEREGDGKLLEKVNGKPVNIELSNGDGKVLAVFVIGKKSPNSKSNSVGVLEWHEEIESQSIADQVIVSFLALAEQFRSVNTDKWKLRGAFVGEVAASFITFLF